MVNTSKPLPWSAMPVTVIEKLVAEVSSDGLTLAEALAWILLITLTNSIEKDARGVLADREGMPLSVRALAKGCGVNRATIRRAIHTFAKRGWIIRGKNRAWRIADCGSWLAETGAGSSRDGGRPATGGVPGRPGTVAERPASGDPATCRGAATSLSSNEKDPGIIAAGAGIFPNPLLRDNVPSKPPSRGIQTTEKRQEENNIDRSELAPVPERQRPGTEANDTFSAAVAAVFERAVGRPPDEHDRRVLDGLAREGQVSVEEIARAIEHGARTQADKVRRSGLRYLETGIRRGQFRANTQTPRPWSSSQAPTGTVKVDHLTPELIQRRRDQKLMRLKEQESALEAQ